MPLKILTLLSCILPAFHLRLHKDTHKPAKKGAESMESVRSHLGTAKQGIEDVSLMFAVVQRTPYDTCIFSNLIAVHKFES